MRKVGQASLGWVGALLLWSASAAAEVESLAVFEHMPVLEKGRVMPVDTYARSKLLGFSGRSTFKRGPASAWLARVLFHPETTREDEIFLVNNPEVLEAIGIPAEGRERYSFAQLEPALGPLRTLATASWKLEEDARSPVESELIRLYDNLVQFSRLGATFTFAIPHEDLAITDPQLRADLELPADQDQFSFLDLLQKAEVLQQFWTTHGEVPEAEWTGYHRDLFRLPAVMSAWSKRQHEGMFNIIPLPGHGDEVWLGPWDVISFGSRDVVLQGEMAALNTMVQAFRNGDQVPFDIAARTFVNSVAKRAPNTDSLRNLSLEVRYNKADLFYRAEFLYGLGFLLILFSIMYKPRWLYVVSLLLVLAAFVPHTAGILARMKIMGRPPVTNLYTTFIFVGWTSVILGLALEYFQRNRLGLLTAAVSGLALLLTAGRFATDGDTMGVMVAVLDSNFWLATHVVCITVGYAGCCVAGLVGHIYLVQALRRAPDDPVLKETFSSMYGALAFGLIFSFLGTMLGGIWADQSWGRFWGWDPKENGALVIVLWSAVLFHAKPAKMIGPVGFAAGCVLGVVWVLLAWLGVNLLGTGLHSYGFTSGLARSLFIACAVEVLFVAATVPFVKRAAQPA
jgi:ABC-type transport system involved in cytochrome c biogenesis permease subunit